MSAPTPPNEPILPRHVDPHKDERRSCAPYNFVPLPDAMMPAPLLADGTSPWQKHDIYVPGLHSGWIDLTIRTETPMYVRCAPPVEHADDEEPRTNRHRQEFFNHGDPQRPVLPGSSLRGLIRSLVEVLAHAKLTSDLFSNRRLIYRAVGDTTSLGVHYRDAVLGPNQVQLPRMRFEYPVSRLRGGYLRQRGSDWFIQPAQTINGETFVHVEYDAAGVAARPMRQQYGAGDLVRVFLRPPARRMTPHRSNRNLILNLAHVPNTTDVVHDQGNAPCPSEFHPAVVVRSGHMTGGAQKHMHCAIYEPDNSIPESAWLPIDRDLWEAYEEDRDLTRGIPTRPLRNDGDPLFYLVDDQGGLIFFGPTMMFRMPYPHRLAEFLPARLQGHEVDLAEAVFGRVRPSPIKGRVFVEDAVWNGQGGSPFFSNNEGRRTPQILGTPKPTAFQHYLIQPLNQQPGAPNHPLGSDKQTLCNYHHPVGNGPFDLTDNQGRTIAQTDGTVIRGYKRYWHKPEAKDSERFTTQVHPTQGTIIRPVKAGTCFAGRLRFENLTNLELGALLTALQLPPSKRHHLGMGKPLGLGSIQIEAQLHLTNRERRYVSLFDDGGQVNRGETESDGTAEQCRAAFAQAVVAHHNASSTPHVANSVEGLWSIPRIQDLSTLLEWDNAPPEDRTSYAPPDVPQGDLRWWRSRQVLPTPHLVAGGPQNTTSIPSPPPPSQSQSIAVSETPSQIPRAANYKAGDHVQAVLLLERTKKGGWKGTLEGTDMTGPIQGTPPPDAESKVGKSIELILASYRSPKTISFWWPDSAPQRKGKKR